jgi:hypothetical protein
MSAQPTRGDRVTVRWPGGRYDFVIEYTNEEPIRAGWVVVHGLVMEPSGPQHRAHRGFYAQRTGPAEYTMLPHRG